jgi:hypothetical protein
VWLRRSLGLSLPCLSFEYKQEIVKWISLQLLTTVRSVLADMLRLLHQLTRSNRRWLAMPKINDFNSGETARMELRGIEAVLEAMGHRQVDVIYLADLLHDYQGNAYRGGCGWQLSRATAMRIKAMFSS